MSPAVLKLLPSTIDQELPRGGTTGFEIWARREGLDISLVAENLTSRCGLMPATYFDDRTECAWRAWANKPDASPAPEPKTASEWRVALCWSATSPGRQERVIVTGPYQIGEMAAHKDFVRWLHIADPAADVQIAGMPATPALHVVQ